MRQEKELITKAHLKELTYQVIGAAIDVHKALGPGLLESVYHKCLKHELGLREINFFSELIVPVSYKGVDFDTELRSDFYVENCLVVELKAVETILPVHEAQVLTYMNLLKAPQGIIINFNCTNIYEKGQKTYVNYLFRELPD